MPSYDANKGSKCARETREELGVASDGPLDCVLSVIEEGAGIPVGVIDMDEGWAGAYLRRGEEAFVFINMADAAVRQRFSLAHEFGHHRLGHEPVSETWEAIFAEDRPPSEVQANYFAAELLAPKAAVLRRYEEAGAPAVSLDVVCRLAAHFGVSAHVARYRLEWAGILDAGSPLVARLDREIAEGDHEVLAGHLGLTWPDDELARIADRGPRAPEAGMLGALVRGEAGIETAAAAVGRDPGELGEIVEDAGIPC